MTAPKLHLTMPDSVFFPLWKFQFQRQLTQMYDHARLVGYPLFDNLGDFCLHIYQTCPDLINERLN